MKIIHILFGVLFCACVACNEAPVDTNASSEQELEALAYTLYSDKSELFVEFQPLIVGEECRFAAHFTVLGEYFKALAVGTVTLTLHTQDHQVVIVATEPQIPGIYRLRMTPEMAGAGKLIFDIKTPDFEDQIVIEDVVVFGDRAAAKAAEPASEASGSDITYLKEQAWKVEFANATVEEQPIHQVIRTNGKLISAPQEFTIVAAKADGIVHFNSGNWVAGTSLQQGTSILSVRAGDLVNDNIDVQFEEAKSKLNATKKNYERLQQLIQAKLVTQNEFQTAQLEYENAQTRYNNIARNYANRGQTVTTESSGFINEVFVKEGAYVTAGTPLLSVSKNQTFHLIAQVSQKYFGQLSEITTANFMLQNDDATRSISEFSGRLLSVGNAVQEGSAFIPVTFELKNNGSLFSGSAADVFLIGASRVNAKVIPLSSLIEEQGVFYVYVQMEGESFQKREVKLGASDGISIEVLSGVELHERVVTKGAYQIKLSTASGTMPAHGHEH
jgi:membrane fusion protein, heavy metal efflux system